MKMVEQQRYEEVKRRVKQISIFYQHLAVYIFVNTGLAVINLTSNPNEIWFTYPLIGWGIGIAAHGLSVFFGGAWTKSWEERKIRELMEKES